MAAAARGDAWAAAPAGGWFPSGNPDRILLSLKEGLGRRIEDSPLKRGRSIEFVELETLRYSERFS